MERSLSTVPTSRPTLFRVFLFENGVWVPISDPTDHQTAAIMHAGWLATAHPEHSYSVRQCGVKLH